MAALETNSLPRQAIWVVGGRCIGIGATFASNILAARLLGPAEYGTFLLISTLLALGVALAMVGLNEAGLRFVAESLGRGRQTEARNYVLNSLQIAAIAAAVVAPLLGLVAMFFVGEEPVTKAMMAGLVAVGIVGLVWQKLGTELARAYGDLKWVSFLSGGQTGGPLSNLVFMLSLFSVGAGLLRPDAITAVALVVGSICVTAPFVYLLLREAVCSVGGSDGEESLATSADESRRGLLTVAAVIFASQLLGFAAQQIDLWLAGAFLTSEAVGLFGAAKRSILVVAMPVQMATMTIVGVIPRLYAMNRPDELERTVRGAATAAAVPSLVVLAAIVCFPRLSLEVVFGDAYASATLPLLMLTLGQVVLVVSGNPQHVLTMTGRHRAVFVVNLFASMILLFGGAFGARVFGAAGLAAASAGSLAFQNAMMWWIVRRELGIWTHISFGAIVASVRRRLGFGASGEAEASGDVLASAAAVSSTSGG